MVDVKGTAVLHPNEGCFLTAPAWALAEADGPFYFSLIHCGMIALQPTWKFCTATVKRWTCSRHCYSWNIQEAIPTGGQIIVTFYIFRRGSVLNVSVIIFQNSVELAHISWKVNQKKITINAFTPLALVKTDQKRLWTTLSKRGHAPLSCCSFSCPLQVKINCNSGRAYYYYSMVTKKESDKRESIWSQYLFVCVLFLQNTLK